MSPSSKQNNLRLGFVYLGAHISKRLLWGSMTITGNASSKFISLEGNIWKDGWDDSSVL